MIFLLTFIVAMSISMAAIPLLIRVAPTLGMIDIPDARKVHEIPIPRVGGIGIVIGAIIPILLWTKNGGDWLNAYLFGSIVLLVFGVWDDVKQLGHYVKFVGQLIAVIPIVYYADLYVSSFPFMNLEYISPAIGKPFTVFAIMGMINAINHSDGLDGLAGGMTVLSLVCIGYLAFLAEGFVVISIVVAALGGVFGFLRYNNHPARVFMGDGGSQFLGFTLGVLAVVLTQKINPVLSPALPLFILGLPIADILVVFWLRAHGGMNWFRATKNHIHHRLLELGFDHYESVVTIYSVQILFVLCAVFLSYESDWLIASIYVSVCTLIFVFLMIGEKNQWQAHRSRGSSRLSDIILTVKQHKYFILVPKQFIGFAIPILFIVVAAVTNEVPKDLAISSIFLLPALLVFLYFSKNPNSFLLQAIIYVTAAFIIYIESNYIAIDEELHRIVEIAYFVPLVIVIGLAVRYSGENRFKASPMDYLVIFIALFTGLLQHAQPSQTIFGLMIVKLVIVFYGCEFIINRMNKRWSFLNISTIFALLVIGLKGLL